MEDHQDDFLKHIKEVLRNHEEEYQPGAWEQFSRQHVQASPAKAGRVVPLWKRIAVAAAVLAGVLLIADYFVTKDSAPPPDIAKDTPVEPKNGTAVTDQTVPSSPQSDVALSPPPLPGRQLPASGIQQRVTAALQNENNGQLAQNDLLKQPPVFPEPSPVLVETPAPAAQTPEKARPAPFTPNRVTPPREETPRQPAANPYNQRPLFAHELPEAREDRRSKKWTPSVYISPMFGESDVNMGYGIALGYAVNDKIKISAGVAHNKMTASRDFDVSFTPPNAALNSAAKGALTASAARSLISNQDAVQQPQLERVNATLSGFDIPVDISYNITSRLYATAGVSGMVVVKDNALYYYKDAENQQISVENNQGILQEDKNIQVIKSSVSNSAPEASGKERTPFLGFYNMSLGYKQKITNKNNVAIEPFLKVPMKNISDQRLNYTGMGIRLKFDF